MLIFIVTTALIIFLLIICQHSKSTLFPYTTLFRSELFLEFVEKNDLKDNFSSLWKRRRSEEHTSELQSLRHLVCRLLLEKKYFSRSFGSGEIMFNMNG